MTPFRRIKSISNPQDFLMSTTTFPTINSTSLFSGDSSHFRLTREELMDRRRRRKREDDGAASGGKKRPKGSGSATAGEKAADATEEEVEEFYAILRRIHAVVKYFEKGKKGKGLCKLTLSELEALLEDDRAPQRRGRRDDPSLDLNSEPSSQTNVASGLPCDRWNH